MICYSFAFIKDQFLGVIEEFERWLGGPENE